MSAVLIDHAHVAVGPRRLRLADIPDPQPVPTSRPPRRVPTPRPPADHQLRLIISSPARPVADPGDAPDFAHRIAQAIVDVLAGHRPATQLIRWARPDVFETVRARAGLCAPGGGSGRSGTVVRRPVVRSVRTCQVTADVVEASAVIVEAERVRALAMRLEGVHGRWRVTALVIG